MTPAERRRRIVFWINDNLQAGEPGRCIHCGGGPETAFEIMYCVDVRADVHVKCRPAWWAGQEALAIKALA